MPELRKTGWVPSGSPLRSVLRVNRDGLLSGLLSDTDVQSYGIDDGVQGWKGVSRDRTIVADPEGRIWISRRSGLSLADPIVTTKNSVPVTVRIESMLADESQVNAQNPIKIPSGIQSIALNYGNANFGARTNPLSL